MSWKIERRANLKQTMLRAFILILFIIAGAANAQLNLPASSVLVYAWDNGNENLPIHLLDDTGLSELLDLNDGANYRPACSADGRALMFLSESGMQITDNRLQEPVTIYRQTIDNLGGLAVNAIANLVAFVRPGSDGNGDIWTINTDGTNLSQITNSPDYESQPAINPQATRILFTANVSQRTGIPNNLEIFAINVDGSDLEQITSNGAINLDPHWSPDGQKIVFTSNMDDPLGADIYVIDASGGSLSRLTDDPAGDFFPAWSPDGTTIAFVSKRTGEMQLFQMQIDGSHQVQLTNSPGYKETPCWLQTPGSVIIGVTQTHQRQDGNRLVAGAGTFPNVQMREYALGQPATWLVGIPQGDGAQWYAALADGRVLIISDEGPEALDVQLAPGQPFAVVAHEDGSIGIVFTDGVQESALTSVTLLDDGTRMTISPTGEIVSDGMSGRITLPVAAPPDARIALSENGLAATYMQASSDRYAHGILGDTLEGTHLLVLDPASLNVITNVALPENDVFEGLMPLWADVDGDGADDLVTMVSNSEVGTRLRIYRAYGSALAESDPIGRGFRWRHALAFAAFGPDGERELVEVTTPHIGGVVRFHRYEDGRLREVAALPGYTSHVIGTRNLDMAVAGDFDGDGQPEIVLADQGRTTLNGLRRTANGIELAWTLPLDGVLATNLAAVMLADGTLALAAGTEDGRLRIWTAAGV